VAQVLDNLLSNAHKYAAGTPVVIRSYMNDNAVKIEVEDAGPGIPTEHLPRLFERFYRVPDQHANVRGTGLGLYICRKILEAHGGEISVASQPGAGTRFNISLPVHVLAPTTEAEGQDV
jgi:signal transduction histidine kinase